MTMRTLLGLALTATLLLAGCSDDTSTVAEDPASSSPSDGPTSRGPVDFEVVELVSESAVGGEVSPTAVDLSDPDGIARLSDQFEDQRMGDRIQEVVDGADVPPSQSLVGAVVAVGCTPPTDVLVEATERGLQVTAVPVKDDQECFAPVTTVAVVAIPAAYF